jgi:TolB-like protein
VGKFISELRRRRVHRAAVAYFVSAWLVVEVSSLVFPALLLPDWTHRLVVILAIIAFPAFMVLAWIFDITPRGVEKTEDIPDEEPAQDDDEGLRSTPPSTDDALASIAVVPFAALSTDAADQHAAHAISAEIAIALSRLPELRVAPTRRLQPGQDAIEPHSIAAEFDVQYVLTGSLRRKPQTRSIRIIAELNDVPNNRVLWSEAYEQPEGSPAGTLEEDIAAAIVGSVGGERLRVDLSRALESHASENPQARDYVYQARAYLLNYQRDSVIEAEKLARKAVELDAIPPQPTRCSPRYWQRK